MFKNLYFRLGLISSIFTIALLIVLPRIPIVIDNKIIKIDSSLGGYYFTLPGGKVLDFRQLKEGLDLQGGIRIVLQADMSKIDSTSRDSALESAKDVITRRIDPNGVLEPVVTTSKVGEDYRIVAEIPGVDNITDVVDSLKQVGKLSFKQLAPDKVWSPEKAQEYFIDPASWVDTPVTGIDLKGVSVEFPNSQTASIQQANSPQVKLQFTNEGLQKFSDLAKANINKPIALFLDQSPYPLSMPVVSADLAKGLTGDPVISGNFDVATANSLVRNIKSGALPVPVTVLQQQTIGATLGSESVQKSFFAGAVGLFLLFLFLVFHYRKLGLIAGVSLLIYSIVVLAIFKIVPVVLTLPGIAGFILSIGMATDANILIFERTKEEILWGKPRSLAIKLGFERAWSSIKDSNISSLLTAGVLYKFGSGPVKGFALTLAIGIGVSLFSSIFVVRTLVEAFNIGRVKVKQ